MVRSPGLSIIRPNRTILTDAIRVRPKASSGIDQGGRFPMAYFPLCFRVHGHVYWQLNMGRTNHRRWVNYS